MRSWVAIEDVARYRDAIGAQPPPGLPPIYLEAVSDALESLVARYARSHGPFSLEEVARRYGLSSAQIAPAVRRLVLGGKIVEGEYRPGGTGAELCDVEVLRRLRRQTLAALCKSIAPVDGAALARFLPAWHGIASERGGIERTREALYALEGLPVPFSELEQRLLPARVAGYQPRYLDELGAAGELVWIGRGAIGSDDGRVAMYFRDHVDKLSDPPPSCETAPLQASILSLLQQRGAAFFAAIMAAHGATPTHELEGAIWDLAWTGQITNDTFAPLRALGRVRRSTKPIKGRTSPTVIGRWSLVGELLRAPAESTAAAHARVLMLLERHGILTREAMQSEELPGGLLSLAPVLRAMEDAGRVRRGYFVEGLSGSQYALPGALDRLRAAAIEGTEPRAIALSAIDPANPYGLLLDWPPTADETASRPRRVAGAVVVLVGARPTLFLEKGWRKLTIFAPPPDTDDPLPGAIEALRRLASDRAGLRIAEINGRPALRSPHASELERNGFRLEPNALVLDEAR
jgi:ATP-dependent Lhr-like helicase